MHISSAQMPAFNGAQHPSLQAAKPDDDVGEQLKPAAATADSSNSTNNASADVKQQPSSTANGESSESSSEAAAQADGGVSGKEPNKDPLSDTTSAEYAQVQELSARDTEVRAHEQAHLSAAGQYATGGPTYSYQTGPDGRQYAIGGEVGIDVSAIPDDPEATIAKMEVVQRAATAPAEPSGQDMRVAAQASQTASAARAQIASEQFEKMQGNDPEASNAGEDKPQAEVMESATAKEAKTSYSEQQGERGAGSFEATA